MDARDKRISFLILRLFLVQFWLLQFFGKLRDQDSGVVAIRNLGIWAKNTTGWMVRGTPLPEFMVRPYTAVVPYVELAIGLLLLVGFRMRETLIGASLLIVSLDVGMMLQLKHDVVANNTVILGVMLAALGWEREGRVWALDARRPTS